MKRSTVSERALILAPRGRDAPIAAAILHEAGFPADACTSLPDLIVQLNAGAAFVVVTEEALATADLSPLAAWLADQQEWSDLPFVLLTTGGGGLERNPAARRYLELLGNVTFLERPFHPTTLVSFARSALRGRRRQYEARARLEALRESEARLRALNADLERQVAERTRQRGRTWQVSPDLLGVSNTAGYFTTSNPAWEQTLGWTHDEIARTPFLELVHPDDVDRTVAAFEKLKRGEPVLRFENRYRRKDGSYRWISWVAVPEGEEFYCSGRDVTAEKEQASELAERTAERDRLWTLSEDMLARADYQGMMSAVSPAWTRVLGWSETELLSRPYSTFMHPDDMGPTLAALARMGETGQPTRFENRIAVKDGGWKPIEWTVAPEAEGVNFIAVGRDLSAMKMREAELAAAQDALRQSQKLEAVGQLTGGVAHDFNNLLTIIKASTGFLRRPDLAEERRRRYVDAISDTVDRASKLTGQLLAFARRQALKPEVFNVPEQIQATVDMLHTVVGSRVKIITDLGPESCFVKADVSQFETALVNMVVNARDAMNGEGRLTIRVTAESAMPAIRGHRGNSGPFVAVSLSDTGSGIPGDRLPHIFEPFYTTKEVGKGTGLGLSQVYGFAKQSGGDVAVESQVGQGTTFTLFLPRADDNVVVGAMPDTSSGPAIAAGRGRRVLVVEDNVEVGTFSTQLLQDLGYETTWAANAEEALAILSDANGFDAVFSDVVMPGMSGVELGREIRRRHPGLPVVLTSGYSHILAEEGRHGFELLQKPYAAEDLARVLRRITRDLRPQRQ